METKRSKLYITKEDFGDSSIIVVVNGLGEQRTYKVLQELKNGLYLCEDRNGIKECFSKYDCGEIKGVKIDEDDENHSHSKAYKRNDDSKKITYEY